MSNKTFFIVDDHTLMRQGIVTYLKKSNVWTCVGQANSLGEAHTLFVSLEASNNLPAVVIEDLNLGTEDGLDFIKELHTSHPEIKSLVYSMYTSSGVVQRCLSAGASGYISKSAPESEFAVALDTVFSGQQYIEQRLLVPLLSLKDALTSLTKREREVLELTISGFSNQDISNKLNIDKRAVENYLSRVYSKTGCKDHTELCSQFGQ